MPEVAWMQAALGGLFGLLIGSFLNVVIYRLPKMMERQWTADCAEATGQPAPTDATEERFNLLVPRSRCQQCGHAIRWYENVPIASYLFLRGRCSSCKTPISPRYPAVELATGLLFAWCAWRWGVTWTAGAWCLFAAVLVALTLIDWDTTLLPDDLTLPLLWAGLIASMTGWTGVALPDAVWGAIGGYLSLWLVYWAFKLATGKEGMGYGDFKLFAALGAWFGWQALVPIILMASVIGAIVGIGLKLMSSLREGGVVPFGPFLAMAGITAMIFGPQSILRAVGL
ncbi:prepilin peptidase [Ottowia sp.]|uniref:prepilin peptidase n=1 Tax=Ottowia sp. TaxID=1898956 RepID=UPI0039E4ABA7